METVEIPRLLIMAAFGFLIMWGFCIAKNKGPADEGTPPYRCASFYFIPAVLLLISSAVLISNEFDRSLESSHRDMQKWEDWRLHQVLSQGLYFRGEPDYAAKGVAFDLLAHRELDGSHAIHRMLPSQIENESHLRGSLGGAFIFGFGGISGSVQGDSSQKATITFAWKMRDGAYAITTLPVTTFRVRLVDKAEPSVEFSWDYTTMMGPSSDATPETLSKYIRQVTVTCDPKDWPVNITLPMDK